MTSLFSRRDLLVAAGATLLGAAVGPSRILAQPASPDAGLVPVAALPEPTDDGIDVPVLGIAFGSEEIIATPEVQAGVVRLLTALPYEDFGSAIFRIPDDQPDAIDQVFAAISQPEPVAPDWFSSTIFPGGVRTDARYGGTAEGFITLPPGTYAVIDLATGQSTTFVARDYTVGAIDPKDVPYVGASYAYGVYQAPKHLTTVNVTALDSMTFDGLDGGIPAGRQLWQLTNGGEMNHNVYIFGTPEGVTPDDILDGILNDDGSGFDGFTGGLMNTQALSPGAAQHFYLDLPPGPHAVMCTESADWQSPPHLFMGMIATFSVA